ncbi:MAG: hypothetical protein A2Y38_24645 [Spirochaetes bacterium GWB1_59_5]|nr:MAG: hypothetical protein A2Y38_24645 [Spirochaetes bacterium GWB1_59_5]
MRGNGLNVFKRVPDSGLEFKRFFGVRLWDFWSPAFGFDLVKFEDWLKPGGGRSIRDAILERHGARAVQIVETLLKA